VEKNLHAGIPERAGATLLLASTKSMHWVGGGAPERENIDSALKRRIWRDAFPVCVRAIRVALTDGAFSPASRESF
jgi:hypothetical protein